MSTPPADLSFLFSSPLTLHSLPISKSPYPSLPSPSEDTVKASPVYVSKGAEDREEEGQDVRWSLLKPGFLVGFRCESSEYACVGLSLPVNSESGKRVLMSMEFLELKGAGRFSAAEFAPFEFDPGNVKVVEIGKERVLVLGRYSYVLTSLREGRWQYT